MALYGDVDLYTSDLFVNYALLIVSRTRAVKDLLSSPDCLECKAFTRSISYREPCGKEGRTRNSLGRMNEGRKEERLNERKERGAW